MAVGLYQEHATYGCWPCFSKKHTSRLNWKEKFFLGKIFRENKIDFAHQFDGFSKALTPDCNMGLTHSNFILKAIVGDFLEVYDQWRLSILLEF